LLKRSRLMKLGEGGVEKERKAASNLEEYPLLPIKYRGKNAMEENDARNNLVGTAVGRRILRAKF